MSQTPHNLIGLNRHELEDLAVACGQQPYRGRQLYHGLYGRLVKDCDAFTDLDRSFRASLAAQYQIAYPAVVQQMKSKDDSIRYLFSLEDGEAVEAVYMPWRLERRGARDLATPSGRDLPSLIDNCQEMRTTLCISSQVGCALNCRFCFTGLLGARRNLTPGEIVGQVLAIARTRGLWGEPQPQAGPSGESADAVPTAGDGNGRKTMSRSANPPSAPRVNIVFMGQGEPLLNLSAVLKAVEILADTAACGVPLRRITVSTAGIAPRIYDLGRESLRPRLAISLNASHDEQRDELMPINRKYPLNILLEACRSYPLRPRERLTFEYVMLDGVNDTEPDALRVAHLLNGLSARVNLIPYNGGSSLPYRPSPLERVHRFEQVLRARGVPAFIRISRGQDIMAACGQLSLANHNGLPAPATITN